MGVTWELGRANGLLVERIPEQMGEPGDQTPQALGSRFRVPTSRNRNTKYRKPAMYRGERDNRRNRYGLLAVLAERSTDGQDVFTDREGGGMRPERPTEGKVKPGIPRCCRKDGRDTEPTTRLKDRQEQARQRHGTSVWGVEVCALQGRDFLWFSDR